MEASSPAPSSQTKVQPPPHVQLIQMGMGYWVSRLLYAAARYGLADLLADRPKTAAELAGPTGTHAPTLHRVMRTMAGLGILTEDSNRRFALTSLGEALKTGAPGAARSSILALAGEWWWKGWEHFLHCVETGETGMSQAYGMSIFEFMSGHPEEAADFNEAMIGFHGDEPAAIAAAYDFASFGTVVDVGGGIGTLLSAILEAHPGVKGILAEMPHVLPTAQVKLEATGLKDRARIEPTDFFKSVPPGGNVYILSHIIHDWTEEQCLTILCNCKAAMGPHGRLPIVETVMPADNAPHPVKLLDIAMLVMPGGEERTEEQYRELLGKAGFRMARVVPTASPAHIVEAFPA
jgi:hypothetical protein